MAARLSWFGFGVSEFRRSCVQGFGFLEFRRL